MRSLQVGCAISLQKTILTTVSSYPLPVCQFFLGSRNSYTPRMISESDAIKTREYLASSQTHVYVHLPYSFNLAKADFDPSFVENYLEAATRIGAASVLHIGKHLGGKKLNLDHYEEAMFRLQSRLSSLRLPPAAHMHRYPLLLENAAGQGTEIGWNWDELRRCFEVLDNSHNFGLCFDTQHAFGAGMSNFGSPEAIDDLFDAIELTVGLPRLRLIHLNDSARLINSRVDRHSPLTTGYIWSAPESQAGLGYLLSRGAELEIDFVCETSQGDHDIRLARICEEVVTLARRQPPANWSSTWVHQQIDQHLQQRSSNSQAQLLDNILDSCEHE